MIFKLLGETLQYIVRGAFSVFKAWWTQEKRTQAEWLAKTREGQLESLKSTLEIETKLNDSFNVEHAASSLPSPSAWNAGKSEQTSPGEARRGGRASLMIVVFMLVFFPGCLIRTVYVESRWPVLPRPSRPVVSEEPWTPREEKLVKYSISLEEVLGSYNEEARSHNAANGY